MTRLCNCGLVYEVGQHGMMACPRCTAEQAARVLCECRGSMQGCGAAAISALSLIVACVGEWPWLLVPGDEPGNCMHCGAQVPRRWDCVCTNCLDRQAEEDGPWDNPFTDEPATSDTTKSDN